MSSFKSNVMLHPRGHGSTDWIFLSLPSSVKRGSTPSLPDSRFRKPSQQTYTPKLPEKQLLIVSSTASAKPLVDLHRSDDRHGYGADAFGNIFLGFCFGKILLTSGRFIPFAIDSLWLLPVSDMLELVTAVFLITAVIELPNFYIALKEPDENRMSFTFYVEEDERLYPDYTWATAEGLTGGEVEVQGRRRDRDQVGMYGESGQSLQVEQLVGGHREGIGQGALDNVYVLRLPSAVQQTHAEIVGVPVGLLVGAGGQVEHAGYPAEVCN